MWYNAQWRPPQSFSRYHCTAIQHLTKSSFTMFVLYNETDRELSFRNSILTTKKEKWTKPIDSSDVSEGGLKGVGGIRSYSKQIDLTYLRTEMLCGHSLPFTNIYINLSKHGIQMMICRSLSLSKLQRQYESPLHKGGIDAGGYWVM